MKKIKVTLKYNSLCLGYDYFPEYCPLNKNCCVFYKSNIERIECEYFKGLLIDCGKSKLFYN
jgi:hypothetical protein